MKANINLLEILILVFCIILFCTKIQSQCIEYGSFDVPQCDVCAPPGWTPINAAEIDPIDNYLGPGACQWDVEGPSPNGGNVVSLNIINGGTEGIETIVTGLTIGTSYQLGFWWMGPTFYCGGTAVICCSSLSITVNGEEYIFDNEGIPGVWQLADICVVAESESVHIIVTGVTLDGMQGQIILDNALCEELSSTCCTLILDGDKDLEVCPNEDVSLFVEESGSSGNPEIMWISNPIGGLAYLDDLNSFDPIFNYPETNSDFTGLEFVFTAVVEDDSCAREFKIDLTVLGFDPYTFSIDNTVICSEDEVYVFPSNTDEGYNGTWDVPSINIDDYVGTSFTNTFYPNDPSIICPIEREFTIEIVEFVENSFDFPLSYCRPEYDEVIFPTVSVEGITGSWLPASIALEDYPDGLISLQFIPDDPCSTVVDVDIEIIPGQDVIFEIPSTFCVENEFYFYPNLSEDGIFGSWDFPFIDLSSPNSYTNVFHADSPGCYNEYSVTVTVENVIQVNFDYPAIICRLAGELMLEETSLEGIPGQWDIPVFDPDTITGNSIELNWSPDPGASDCVGDVTISINITDSIEPDFAIPTSLCELDPILTLPNSSANGIAGTWSIMEIDPSMNSGTVMTTFSADPMQCATDLSWEIEIIPFTEPEFELNTELCAIDPIFTLNTTSDNGILGTWSIPEIDPSTNPGGTITSTFTPSNTNQCSGPFTIEFTISPEVAPLFNIPDLICPDAVDYNLPSTSNNGVSGAWTIPIIEVQNNLGNTITSSFIPDGGQCSESIELEVTILPAFDNTLNTTDPSSCVDDDGSIEVGGNLSGYEFSIDGGQTWTSQSLFDQLAPGNYEIAIRSIILPNCSTTLNVSLSTLGAPIINSIDLTQIENCTDLVGSAVVNASGTNLEYSIDGGITWQSSPFFDDLPAGTYLILVHEIAAPDCATESTININSFPTTEISNVNSLSPSDCDVEDGQIIIEATGQNLQYSIDGGLNFTTNNIFNNLAAGEYEIIVQSIDAMDCEDIEITVLIAPNSPSINQVLYADEMYCEPTLVSFEVEASGSNLEYSIDGGASWQTTNIFEDLDAGTYSIVVRNIEKPGCSDSFEYMLDIDIAEPIEFTTNIGDQDCPSVQNGFIEVQDVAGGFGDYMYSIDGINFQNENTFYDLESNDYEVIVIDSEACMSSQNVSITSQDFVDISLEDVIQIESGESVVLDPGVNTSEVDSFQWSPTMGLLNPNSIIVEAGPTETTTYSFIIYYGACSDTVEVLIEVEQREIIKKGVFYTGNVFSPNGDGINENFYIQTSADIEVHTIAVFDRWGNQVFKKDNPRINNTQDGWDGTFNGRQIVPGVYVYFVDYEIDGSREIFSGSVTLIR